MMKPISAMRRALRLLRTHNDYLLNFPDCPAAPHRVNLNWWQRRFDGGRYNLGDLLSPAIVGFLLGERGLSLDIPVPAIRHMSAIGSIMLYHDAYQDITVWGSGVINDCFLRADRRMLNFLVHHLMHRVDVRAVRGPRTRASLRYIGLRCPEVYGDPALLLPRFFPVDARPVRDYNVIPHFTDRDAYRGDPHFVDVLTADWRATVRAICSARVNVSGSLHGLILSEAYGIPAVLLLPPQEGKEISVTLFKYEDYYQGTGRREFPVARTLDEALAMAPPPLPDLPRIQARLIDAFPYDLWEGSRK